MLAQLSFVDIQHLVAVKACFFLFLLLAIIAIYRQWKPWVYLAFVGGFSALAYFFFVRHMGLMFWGLLGDEITIAAMYEMFAHGNMLADFAYPQLPPFYPPLWFQAFGFFGSLLHWNGIQIAKLAASTTIGVFPVAFYFLQYWWWNNKKQIDHPGQVAWLLTPLFIFLFIDWDAIIMKPYELVSASLVIFWTTALLYRLWIGEWTKKDWLLFGVSGGILFSLFYFWFFLAAIAIALFHLFHKRVSVRQYGVLLGIALIILAVSAYFWLPLAWSYHANGSENWQLGFLNLPWIATHGPLFVWSIRGLAMLGGFGALVAYRRNWYIRVLLCVFVAGYVWQLLGFATIFFFASPLQEAKGFQFWNSIVLAFAAAYGLERAWWFFSHKWTSSYAQKTILVLATILLSTQLFFGTFVDEPVIQRNRILARAPRAGVKELVMFLEKKGDSYKRTTLHSGITELSAFLPMNHFIYYNMHNSHPAAQFSERLLVVKELAAAKDAQTLYQLSQQNRYGPIGRFIFFQDEKNPVYKLYFHVDNFPHGSKEVIIEIPKKLFGEKFFDRVYENKAFVVFEPRASL